ncbi:hypothetical protein [Paramaledivibacter caminithermalis]|jgi:hypothetical protein|uniref:Uncharacterized protein n=1 Tax=Paramaledivibacter caminithermalis (strain DSM 15212 / CIP 107654 / DViRD3) TaxID=1121301 RepID=A0A1M6NNL8_PARC5|nr:hypothetical protein [Paramaledivibacter caminithermalis]SHJ97273.1 hypothetical protein SAMN02745912_01791 [Paramaledivibacter caminithermalis DSM 15212]
MIKFIKYEKRLLIIKDGRTQKFVEQICIQTNINIRDEICF